MPCAPTSPTLYHSFTIQTPAAWARARRLARLKRGALAAATVVAFLAPSPLQHHGGGHPASAPPTAPAGPATAQTVTDGIGTPVAPTHRGMRL